MEHSLRDEERGQGLGSGSGARLTHMIGFWMHFDCRANTVCWWILDLGSERERKAWIPGRVLEVQSETERL